MLTGSFIGTIVLCMIGLFILYLVIYTAVKDGINKSLLGQFIEEKYEFQEDKKSFFDNDLDSE